MRLRKTNYAKALVLIALVSILFGLSDSMVRNWDHTMHMATIEKSTPFVVEGWKGYGTGYYRLAALAKQVLEPAHKALRLFGIETLGLQASAIFVNLAALIAFFLATQKYLDVRKLSLLAFALIFAVSPIFKWTFRIYPDVALAGLLGVSLVLVLAYAAHRLTLFGVFVSGLLLGLALHIKQPAILLLPCYFGLLFVPEKRFQAVAIFGISAASTYLIIGYPKEYQLVEWLLSMFRGDSDWMAVNRKAMSLPWVKSFSYDMLLMAVLPAVPCLVARSEVFSIAAIGLRKYLVLTAILAASFALIFMAFLLQPVSVGTEHYMIIAFPIMAMIFLLAPWPTKYSSLGLLVLIGVSAAALYIESWKYPIAVLSQKAQEVQCQSSWRQAEDFVRAGDLRSPHIPYGVNAGTFFMAPGTFYDRVSSKDGTRFLVNSRAWLARFGRTGSREREYQASAFHVGKGNWRSASSQDALDKSFELLEEMALFDVNDRHKVGDFEIRVVFEDASCSIRVFDISRSAAED